MEDRPGEQVKNAAQSMSESFSEASDQFQNRLSDAWEAGRDKVAACAQATDRVIRDKPYQSIGIALGLGVLVGLLITRRRVIVRED